MDYPKLRPLSPVPVNHRGQPSYFLRDPLQLNGHSVMLPGFLGPLLALCDGTRDTASIAAIFDSHYGIPLDADDIKTLVEAFDECYLLDNANTRRRMDRVLAEYHAAPYREPASAGGVYPAEPAALSQWLNDYLENVDIEPAAFSSKGLLSPHIDYERGIETYAQIWKRASSQIAESDLFILIGTDHYGGHNPITLTRQVYATPYGPVYTETAIVDKLAEALGEEQAFAGELYHRSEHSLELPLVWLHHLTHLREVSVVPILCGNLEGKPEVLETTVRALKEATAGRKVFYVISGDLAHVGPAFGGDGLDENGKKRVKKVDEGILTRLQNGDAAGFITDIESSGDENNVCGTYPLYLTLNMMDRVKGEIHGYTQCPADENDTSIVSIAGALFH